MLPSDTGRKAYQPDNITFLREAWIDKPVLLVFSAYRRFTRLNCVPPVCMLAGTIYRVKKWHFMSTLLSSCPFVQ